MFLSILYFNIKQILIIKYSIHIIEKLKNSGNIQINVYK